jgi:CubicO group peptidase (beta-lactamase class C family)
MTEREPMIPLKDGDMDSTAYAMKAGFIKHFVQVTQAAVLFVAAVILAVVAWPSSLQAENTGGLSCARTVKPMSPPVDSASLVHLLDSLIVPGLEKYHIPGMIIAVVHNSDIVVAKGYGYANLERKIPLDPDSTVIRMASVSKLVTGTAILQLAERGVVDMRRDINTYLSRFKVEEWPEKPITLHHLLTHTAGFDDRICSWNALDDVCRAIHCASGNHLPCGTARCAVPADLATRCKSR